MVPAFWKLFKTLYAVETLEGYTEKEIGYLKELFGILPQSGRKRSIISRAHGCCRSISGSGEGLREPDYLILLNENPGVCRVGIRREDLVLQYPPAYTKEDDKNWTLSALTTSEFLSAALAYGVPAAAWRKSKFMRRL